MNNPKISVITTVYNVGEYIDKTIQSMLSQSFTDWEMVLVNDCTPDNSVEKIMQYNDSRLVLINNEVNVGAGKSRQVGIDNANGDFILFLDGDDWLNDECLEKLYTAAIEQDADIVNCWVEKVNDYKLFTFQGINKPQKEEFTTYLGNKLIRRSLFEKTHYSPLRLFEDINTLYRLLHLSKKTIKIDYVGYVYNIRPNSLTTTPNQQHKWLIYHTLAVMENVDYFEGINFDYVQIYNPFRVFYMYYKQITTIPQDIASQYIDEIETIRLWCEDKKEKMKNALKNGIKNYKAKIKETE
jgi:glycosyltransferase involved in cell wall biosynthesis